MYVFGKTYYKHIKDIYVTYLLDTDSYREENYT